MRDHEAPTPEFLDRTEELLRGALRRRRRFAGPRGRRRFGLRGMAIAAVLGVALGSTGTLVAGGGGGRYVRLVTARYEILAEAAAREAERAAAALESARTRSESGLASAEEVETATRAAIDAKEKRDLARSRLAEARRTARHPDEEVSAPLVDGTDFVGDRLRIRAAAGEKRAAAFERRARTAEALAGSGLVTAEEVQTARAEAEAARRRLAAIRTGIELRAKVLDGELSPDRAVLLDMRRHVELDRELAAVRLGASDLDLSRLESLFDAGVVSEAELAAARSARERFETARALAENRLELIDERLGR